MDDRTKRTLFQFLIFFGLLGGMTLYLAGMIFLSMLFGCN